MKDCFKNIEEYHPDRECIASLASDDPIADMIYNKKRNQIVTELFIRGKKLNIFPAFIRQSYFQIPKDVRLYCTHFFIMKKSHLTQQITFNHSFDIEFKGFINLYKICTLYHTLY